MSPTAAVRFGPFLLDPHKRLLLRNGDPVALTPKAFDALVLLVARRDRVVSKQELLREVWSDAAVEEATLSQHVFMLRRALDDSGNGEDPKYIATAQRRGYRFVAPVYPPGPHADRRPAVVAQASAIVAVLIGAIALTALWSGHQLPAPAKMVRLEFELPDDQQLWRQARGGVAISPDGSTVVYSANRQLYARRLNESESRSIPGTRLDASMPFFSPDGLWIGFAAGQDSTLKKVPISGGTALTITDASNPRGASWFRGTIVFAEGERGIVSVSDGGGASELITAVREGEVLESPQILPGNETMMFTSVSVSGNRATKSQVVVRSRKNGNRRTLVPDGSTARYVASGHIIYTVGDTLFAVPFDARTLDLAGEATTIARGVWTCAALADFDISAEGTLVYVPQAIGNGDNDRRLVVIDGEGHTENLAAATASYQQPRVSPDGKRLAVTTDDDGGSIWVCDLPKCSLRRLTFQGHSRFPVWSPDGRKIAFASTREGSAGILVAAADGTGTPERLTTSPPGFEHQPKSWAPDGRTLAFVNVKAGVKDTIWTVTLGAERHQTQILAVHGSNQMEPRISPDGRWIAYTSEGEAGDSILQVYIQPFPATGAKYQVSRDGGAMPAWSADGRRLFYQNPAGGLMGVRIRTEPTLSVGDSAPVLEDETITDDDYDVLHDGRFVVPVPAERRTAAGPRSIGLVVNWFAAMKTGASVPTRNARVR
jgi:eukaryotic-like serine/threonine-protein kinase